MTNPTKNASFEHHPLPPSSASYMVLAGFVLNKPKLYLVTTLCSYPVSLVVTIVSLYMMRVAQPALLYIVPIMMLAIVVTAACAGDLKTLWKMDLMMVGSGRRGKDMRTDEDRQNRNFNDINALMRMDERKTTRQSPKI